MRLKIDINVQTESGGQSYQVVAEDVNLLRHMRPSLTLMEIKNPADAKAVLPYSFLCNTHDGRVLPMTIRVLKELMRMMDLGKLEEF